MTRLLQTLQGPRDLRQLSDNQLPTVARELRDAIRARFAMNDAYLSSALGVADLTVALHYVFDFSQDRLVFDLSHQVAAHRVLTSPQGREGEAPRVEAPPLPGDEKAPFDYFFATHAGASISAALGLASGRGDGGKTVAVIGDGAVVSGMALEALNSGDALDRDVLVILNDNEMSISKVVGAMGEYLSKIRVGKTYNEIKRDAHKLLQAIPFIGEGLDKAAEQLRDVVAKALVPGYMLENLGPRYFGPVDGHNIGHLVQLLSEIKRHRGFYLLHVVTRREPPSADGAVVHPVWPELFGSDLEFERQGEDSWMDALTRAVLDRAESDRDAVAVVTATPEIAGIRGFKEAFARRFPDRIWDMSICEQHGTAFAAGLAKAGRHPMIITVAPHLPRAHGQIFQEVVQQGLPVVFCVGYAGLIGIDSPLAPGLQDVACLRAFSGMTVMAPRDGRELGEMLELALRLDGPSAVRFPHSFVAHPDRLLESRAELALGCPEILRRGSNIAIMALGPIVYSAMEAADLLAEKGLECTVVNARFVRPMDISVLDKLLAEHTLLFTVEEHVVRGGLGAEALELAATERLGAGKIIPIGVPEVIVLRASRSRMLKAVGLDAQGLADRLLYAYRKHVRSPARD